MVAGGGTRDVQRRSRGRKGMRQAAVFMDAERTREMWRCVCLYYVEDPQKKTEQIAELLFMSRSKVSRYLSLARTQGLIRVVVEPPRETVLELQLMSRFRLRDARVVMTGEAVPDVLLPRFLGPAAAHCIEDIVHDNMSIGLAGGTTINETVRALRPAKLANVDVYALVGPTTFDPTTSAAGLIRAMCDKYAAGYVRGHELLQYPPKGRRDKQRILRISPYKEAYKAASNVDLALVGIGALYTGSTLSRTLETLRIHLKDAGLATGDIGYQLFDADGKHIRSPLDDLIIAVPPRRLRHLHESEQKRVIAVAGGHEKTKAILGALRGRFMDMLVTDDRTARSLLSLSET